MRWLFSTQVFSIELFFATPSSQERNQLLRRVDGLSVCVNRSVCVCVLTHTAGKRHTLALCTKHSSFWARSVFRRHRGDHIVCMLRYMTSIFLVLKLKENIHFVVFSVQCFPEDKIVVLSAR